MKMHCCESMMAVSSLSCDQHKNEFECPDVLVSYNEKFDEYGLIIRDGGTAISLIKYCPYCGSSLPCSKRDLWFDALEKLGFDNPTEQNIPEEFLSGKWHHEKTF